MRPVNSSILIMEAITVNHANTRVLHVFKTIVTVVVAVTRDLRIKKTIAFVRMDFLMMELITKYVKVVIHHARLARTQPHVILVKKAFTSIKERKMCALRRNLKSML